MGQITFMRLHDRYTDSFETGEVLNNAYNIKETRIQEVLSLTIHTTKRRV